MLSISVIGSWVRKASLAIIDQGLFSTGTFALTVVLARYLSLREYGAFAQAYSSLLLVMAVHQALIAEPMAVFGPARYATRFDAYLCVLLRGHLLLSGVAAAALYIVALSLELQGQAPDQVAAFVAVGASAPAVLLLVQFRRACYVNLTPNRAAIGSAVFFGLVVFGSVVLHKWNMLSPTSAFLLMAAAALGASPTCMHAVRIPDRVEQSFSHSVTAAHWRYGKSALLSTAFTWVFLNVHYFLLPLWHGLEAAARLRAVMNLISPILQAFVALSLILVPSLVRLQRKDPKQFANSVYRLTVLAAVGATMAGVALFAFRLELLQMFYSGQYSDVDDTAFLMAVFLPVAASAILVQGSALRALEKPEALVKAYLLAMVLGVTVGGILGKAFGTSGALAGLWTSFMAAALTMLFYTKRIVGERKNLLGASPNALLATRAD